MSVQCLYKWLNVSNNKFKINLALTETEKRFMVVFCTGDGLSAEKSRPLAFDTLGPEDGSGSRYMRGVGATRPPGLHILVGGADV